MSEEAIRKAIAEYEQDLKMIETAKDLQSVHSFLSLSSKRVFVHMLAEGKPGHEEWLRKFINHGRQKIFLDPVYKTGKIESQFTFNKILEACLVLNDEGEINKSLDEFPKLTKKRDFISYLVHFMVGVLSNDIELAEEYLPKLNRFSGYDSYTKNLYKNMIEIGRAILDKNEEELEKQIAEMRAAWKKGRSKSKPPICIEEIVFRNLFNIHKEHD